MASRPTLSRSSSTSSASSDWTPTGVYIPVHKRARIGSEGSSPSCSSSDTEPASIPASPAYALDESKPSTPHVLVYSREALLALAPAALINTALRPVVPRSLAAAYPACLRMRGDGIARALSFAREDAKAAGTTAALHDIGQAQARAPCRRSRPRRRRRRTSAGKSESGEGSQESREAGEAIADVKGKVKVEASCKVAFRVPQSAPKAQERKQKPIAHVQSTVDSLESWRTSPRLVITV